jgi:hypothetical protein
VSEAQDPPLRLTIEGLRWMGDEWKPTGTSATVDIHGTDTGDGAEILRLLRAHLARRLQMLWAGVSLDLDALDFDSPNAPTESDMMNLEAKARIVLNAIEGLRELAPEVMADDDEGGEP